MIVVDVEGLELHGHHGASSEEQERGQRFLFDVCEPFLRLFRRILPPLGPLDLSPIVAVFAMLLLQRVIVSLLDRLH